jgi:chromosome segregation ATPase
MPTLPPTQTQSPELEPSPTPADEGQPGIRQLRDEITQLREQLNRQETSLAVGLPLLEQKLLRLETDLPLKLRRLQQPAPTAAKVEPNPPGSALRSLRNACSRIGRRVQDLDHQQQSLEQAFDQDRELQDRLRSRVEDVEQQLHRLSKSLQEFAVGLERQVEAQQENQQHFRSEVNQDRARLQSSLATLEESCVQVESTCQQTMTQVQSLIRSCQTHHSGTDDLIGNLERRFDATWRRERAIARAFRWTLVTAWLMLLALVLRAL